MTSPISSSTGGSPFGLGSLGSSSFSPFSITGTINALLNGIGSSSGAVPQQDSTQVELSGLGQLLSALTTFQNSIQPLEPPTINGNSTVSNTNPAVLTASASATATPASYNVVVGNVAQAQTLESAGFADSGSTSLGTGSLSIQAGTYNSGGNTFTPSSTPAKTVTINTGTLQDIANSINSAATGVFASIAQDNTGFHLVVTNSVTGANNNFEILVNDADGNNTDSAGLSQIAYDPTAAAGSGQNLTQQQAASNAGYTVNGVASSSASNANVTLGPGLTVSILQTGSTTLSVSPDIHGVTSAAQTFVNAYNTLQNAVQSLASANTALSLEPSVLNLTSAFDNQAQGTFSNPGSRLTTLGQIGIDFQFPTITLLQATNFSAGGTLTLSTTTLQTALTGDPNGTQSLIGSAAQTFDSLAGVFGVPNGSVPDLISQLQQIENVNQFLSAQPPATTPSLGDIVGAQPGLSGQSFTTAQISGLQQYAQAFSLLTPLTLESAILGAMTGGSGAVGNLLSVFA
ncbi:MAG: flagellar filament capping protein FliD [Burkholderiales bacterium]|nr:flagellar filament capping protein FliD [Burkholderiales bacterium]